jgi:hypothetical protein
VVPTLTPSAALPCEIYFGARLRAEERAPRAGIVIVSIAVVRAVFDVAGAEPDGCWCGSAAVIPPPPPPQPATSALSAPRGMSAFIVVAAACFWSFIIRVLLVHVMTRRWRLGYVRNRAQ